MKFAAGILGIIGGVLAFAKPSIGGCCMLIGSVGAIILTVVFANGPGICLSFSSSALAGGPEPLDKVLCKH